MKPTSTNLRNIAIQEAIELLKEEGYKFVEIKQKTGIDWGFWKGFILYVLMVINMIIYGVTMVTNNPKGGDISFLVLAILMKILADDYHKEQKFKYL